ncbi:LuxR family transcriptional regulator [Micromonospora andamanensis]|nr:LuxR family transcriptional regulator [Micromonospora andamanensis]
MPEPADAWAPQNATDRFGAVAVASTIEPTVAGRAAQDGTAAVWPAGLPMIVNATGGSAAVAWFPTFGEAFDALLPLADALPSEAAPGIGLDVTVHLEQGKPLPRRATRISTMAASGQVLVSAAAAPFVRAALPAGWLLRDLGVRQPLDLGDAERVFDLVREGCESTRRLNALDPQTTVLPTFRTSFVGRAEELRELTGLLVRDRLVSVIGTGGVGKTRLAARAAADIAGLWPDGVRWVDLSAQPSTSVAAAVAATVGVRVLVAEHPIRSLTAWLRPRRMLLVLDNCEHVLEPVADLVAAVLSACPEAAVLTTSRERLGLANETVWTVPAMSPADGTALFAERARTVHAAFAADHAQAASIRRLCSRLDGLPLAIELAATWVRSTSPEQIEAALDDRFGLLVRSPRGVAGRHQTLLASIDWSYDRLSADEQRALRRMAVFAATFDSAAAGAVCVPSDETSGIEHLLHSLVDKSLVIAETGPGAGRYRLAETMRGYAHRQLLAAGEYAETARCHLAYFLRCAQRASPLLDRDKDTWRAQIGTDHDEYRAALAWGLEQDNPAPAVRLAAELGWWWHLTAHGTEGARFLRRALDRCPADDRQLLARLLTAAALVADTNNPVDAEAQLAARSLAIADELADPGLRSLPALLLAVGTMYDDLDVALELAMAAEDAGMAAGDGFVVDGSRALQGIIHHLRSRHATARTLLRTAIDRLAARGDRGVAATTMGVLAVDLAQTGELTEARLLAEVAVAVAAPLLDHHRVGSSRAVLAVIRGLSGDVEGGLTLLEPVRGLLDSTAPATFVPWLAGALGGLYLRRGDIAAAVRWLEAAGATPDARHTHLTTPTLPQRAAALRMAGRITEARYFAEQAYASAQRLDLPATLADSLEQLAWLAVDTDAEAATDRHHEALAIRLRCGLRPACLDSLDGLAHVAVRRGRHDVAAQLAAAGTALRRDLGYPRSVELRTVHERDRVVMRERLGALVFDDLTAVGERMPYDVVMEFARRGRGRRDRPDAGWDSLTPTELRVVELAVKGLNNPQIAGQLFVSRSTVKAHLAHVYAKLGIANRTELAALAARHETAPPPATGEGRPQ